MTKNITLGQVIVRASKMKQLIALDKTKVKKGQIAPDFEFKSDSGKVMKLSDLKGKVVLINFFSTTCGPCRNELPNIQKEIWEKYGTLKDFELIIIGCRNSKSELKDYKNQNQIKLPIYPDRKNKIYSIYANTGVPQSYIVDRNGVIVYSSVGYYKTEFENMLKTLEEIIRP